MNSKQLRNALIASIGIVLLVSFHFFVIKPAMKEEEYFNLCGDKHYLRVCYNMKRNECLAIWNGTKAICYRRHLEEARKERPALLEGPVTQQCREFEFNKIAKFMNSGSSDEACEGLAERIQTYIPPNPPAY